MFQRMKCFRRKSLGSLELGCVMAWGVMGALIKNSAFECEDVKGTGLCGEKLIIGIINKSNKQTLCNYKVYYIQHKD